MKSYKLNNRAVQVSVTLAALITMQTVRAESKGGLEKGLVASTFDACKDVSLVDYDAYEKNKSQWDKIVKDCGGKVQILPKTGLGTFDIQARPDLKNVTGAVSALDFLQRVAAKTKTTLETNIKLLQAQEACLADKTEPSTELKALFKSLKKEDISCASLKANTLSSMRAVLPAVREELGYFKSYALMSPAELADAFQKNDAAALVQKRVGGGGSSKEVFRVNMEPLSSEEFAKVEAGIAKELQELSEIRTKKAEEALRQRKEAYVRNNGGDKGWDREEREVRDRIKLDYPRWAAAEMEERRAKHRAKYFSMLSKVPMLTQVGKANPSDSELLEGTRKLLSSSKNELKRVDETISGGSLLMNAKLAFNSKDQKDAKNLLAFMANVPMIESVLAEDKTSCATADGLMSHIAKSDTRGAIGTLGGFLVGTGAVAVGGKALLESLALVSAGEAAAAGAGAGFLVAGGVGMGMTVHDAMSQRDTIEGALAGTKSMQQAQDAKDAFVTGVAMAPLNFIGGSAAGALLTTGTRAIVGRQMIREMQGVGIEAGKAVQVLKSAQGGNEEARQIIRDATGRSLKSMFGTDAPEKEALLLAEEQGRKGMPPIATTDFNTRIAKLAKDERKQVMEEAKKIVAAQDASKYTYPPNATPEQIKKVDEAVQKLNKQLVSISRYGKVNDPKKMAAIINEWDNAAKEGLTSTYDSAYALLADEKFMAGKSLKERREGAFKQALENKGVKDRAQAQQMCVCAGECGGASKAARNEFDFNSDVKVCAADSKSVWFIPNL